MRCSALIAGRPRVAGGGDARSDDASDDNGVGGGGGAGGWRAVIGAVFGDLVVGATSATSAMAAAVTTANKASTRCFIAPRPRASVVPRSRRQVSRG
jgi:hypothetical protein